jgi:DNA-binding winged helix-turn-helix (wHTH) protein
MMRPVEIKTHRDAIVFGAFRLVAAQRRLERYGVPITLGSRAFDILHILVENAGHVVAKQELLRQVWPNCAVEDSNLRFQIAMLRKALGAGRFIVTITGRGYSFVEFVSRFPIAPSQYMRWAERIPSSTWAMPWFWSVTNSHPVQGDENASPSSTCQDD